MRGKKKKSHASKFEEMVGVAAGLVLRASESAELNKDLVGSLSFTRWRIG